MTESSRPTSSSSGRAPWVCSRCSSWACSTSRRISSTSSKAGGQCAELYPGEADLRHSRIPDRHRQGLVDNLMKQIEPFGPTFHLNQMVDELRQARPTRPLPRHDRCRHVFDARSWWSRPAAARSSPSGRPSPASRPMRASRSSTRCRKMEELRDRTILIVGGGDSALDWTLNLQPIAKRVTLMHRRDDFRAAPAQRRADARAGRRRERWTCASARSPASRARTASSRAATVQGQRRRRRRDRLRRACCRSSA